MMLEVAEAISEGLMMTQLPAAMAPPGGAERETEVIIGHCGTSERLWLPSGPRDSISG